MGREGLTESTCCFHISVIKCKDIESNSMFFEIERIVFKTTGSDSYIKIRQTQDNVINVWVILS